MLDDDSNGTDDLVCNQIEFMKHIEKRVYCSIQIEATLAFYILLVSLKITTVVLCKSGANYT